jgi:nicotinamidase-related amidase
MTTESHGRADGSSVALLVIDVQQGLFERSTPIYRAEQFLDNLNTLIGAARRAGVPVLFIQHANEGTLVEGSAAWQLHPRIQPLPPEPVVHKRYGNAFEETVLPQELASRRVGTLVITGLVTHGCVRATSLGALELSYRVILVSDGHSNFSKQAARLITTWNQKLHGLGAELRATREIDFSQL